MTSDVGDPKDRQRAGGPLCASYSVENADPTPEIVTGRMFDAFHSGVSFGKTSDRYDLLSIASNPQTMDLWHDRSHKE